MKVATLGIVLDKKEKEGTNLSTTNFQTNHPSSINT